MVAVNDASLSLPPVFRHNQEIDWGVFQQTESLTVQIDHELTPFTQTPCIMAKMMTLSTGFDPHGLELWSSCVFTGLYGGTWRCSVSQPGGLETAGCSGRESDNEAADSEDDEATLSRLLSLSSVERMA